MEELSIYNLTITNDHRLKVNNEDVGGDDSILPGDSEGLLAWALVQVGYIQESSDSNMALQIEDQRPDGYGTQKVTIPPGRRVLIEALRKRTGRDLSYITEQVHQQYAQQSQEAPAPAQEESGQQWAEDAWEETSTESAPESSEESAPSANREPEPESESEWAEDTSTQAPADDDEPVLAPPPVLEEGIPNLPAEPPRQPREHSYDQPLPEEPATQPIQEVNEWAESRQPSQGLDQFSDNWPSVTDTAPAPEQEQDTVPSQESPVETLPSLSPFAQENVTEREDISSKKVWYKRNRPEMGADEAKKIKQKKPKKERSKPMIAAIVVLSLVALFFAVQFIRTQGENSYVATCLDERTMVRQSSDAGCKDDEAAAYYRWWYTPSGSEVPAVNQTVSQDQGTRIRPENATIREGYDAAGGLYGDEDEG